jgi:hypothetical protein
MKYFDNIKLIIVDRDPRDIYVDMVKGKLLLSYDISKTGNVDKYIKWHKKLRNSIKNIEDNNNILFLKFEDLVCNYQSSIKKISEFIGPNFTHINQNKHFIPEESINNIGLWKQYDKQEEINKIKVELCCDHSL